MLEGFEIRQEQGVEFAFERVQAHVAVDLVRGLSSHAALFELGFGGQDDQGLQVEEKGYCPQILLAGKGRVAAKYGSFEEILELVKAGFHAPAFAVEPGKVFH